ncbi:hypothetical protein QUC32_21530 [Novosphingobium resinovorum]|uniref:hypothetical protein n=1 Tax=Sphingomonadaceae TaxID=41297 RepID=UPI00027C98B0|nr:MULTISPECIES: hypothetical protein [Sphingomonadaceae]EJU09400.1 hypothetical protein LH128_29175 [Sphingomonas sp. LH128]EJU09505.1 hypothetical protein LH128_28760 [Sphingomonas sp. LH128]EJU10163.1 hypothetical protein LH128_25313 [Sphingomonas sp. LH128]MBF7012231.1 hypothetical protein [Novosphingobium sp. HR1a]WJM26976.1 hypothetical protein QUC32_21530 [Novosphingobium resinovorum]
MNGAAATEAMQSELDRVILEVRTALGRLALERKITGVCAGILNLIDQSEFQVTDEESESAFRLDRGNMRVYFYLAPLVKVWNELYDACGEIGISGVERVRWQQIGLAQFVIHELIHIRQKFSEFTTVPVIKVGLPGMGLPMLDLAADLVAAWVSALIEVHYNDAGDEDLIQSYYVNALLRAYLIGAFVFDARTNPNKRQRAIGLIISMMLVQAKIDGKLNAGNINEEWTEISPVLALDISRSHRFNAIVIGTLPGLLIEDHDVHDGDALMALWESVGSRPMLDIISRTSTFLKAAGAIAS